MSYWKTVGVSISICFAVGALWQALLLWHTIRMIESQEATGLAIVVHGWNKFLVSVLLTGWTIGSLLYLLRRKS